jgi:hypothetical protein
MKRDFTKDVSVERVTPPAPLGYCKAVGKSERVERMELAQGVGNQDFDNRNFDNQEKAKWRAELFVRYAHRLLACSEEIFADKRLFYTPLPLPLKMWIRRGNSYTPTGLRPTLGHIIVWWQNYKCAQVADEKGRLHYIYGFAFGPICKFGRPRPADAEPDKVRYIGGDDCGYRIPTSHSLFDLGCSLYEVYRRYKHHYCRDHFDLEEAIEFLLGEKVSR